MFPLVVVLAIVAIALAVVVKLLPMKRVIVYEYQKALKYKKGRYAATLDSGQYWVSSLSTLVVPVDIYNDAAGAVEGNSPFQVVWLPDEERDEWLDKVHDLAVQHQDRHPAPIVFEGNAPADIREKRTPPRALRSRTGQSASRRPLLARRA